MRLHHVGRQCFSPIHPVQCREAMLMRKVKEPCPILKTELIRQAKGIAKEFVPIIVVGRISLSPTKGESIALLHHPKCEAVTKIVMLADRQHPVFFGSLKSRSFRSVRDHTENHLTTQPSKIGGYQQLYQ